MKFFMRFALVAAITFSMVLPAICEPLPTNVPLSGFDVYSFNETLTNKVWINGKLIYRKIVDLGYLPNNTEKSVPHGITGVTQWITITAMQRPSDGRVYGTPIPSWFQNQYNANMGLYVSPTDVIVQTARDRTTDIAYAILEYTKD